MVQNYPKSEDDVRFAHRSFVVFIILNLALSPLHGWADEAAPALKVDAQLETPKWVESLRARKLSDYLLADGQVAQDALLADATRLVQYFEPKRANDRNLKESLETRILAWSSRGTNLSAEEKNINLETLVIFEDIQAAKATPRARLTLRGASLAGVGVALIGLSAFVINRLGWRDSLTIAALACFWRSFEAGPIAETLKAAFDWILTPLTENIKVWSAKNTGPLANRTFRLFVPRNRNLQKSIRGGLTRWPNLATIEQDGMDFAGQTRDEQLDNYLINLEMWPEAKNVYGSLLPDTYHHGRAVTMLAWMDEINFVNLFELMETKILQLNNTAETLLTPYKTALRIAGKADEVARLQELRLGMLKAYDKLWRDVPFGDADLLAVKNEVEEFRQKLVAAGVSEDDSQKLLGLIRIRERSIATQITALALNEIRLENYPESNRELQTTARVAQRRIRRGFDLQTYVDRYVRQIQAVHRAMGYKNSDKGPGPRCEELMQATYH